MFGHKGGDRTLCIELTTIISFRCKTQNETIMNFPIFALMTLLGACILFWLEDKAKESGDPIPQSIMGLGVFCICFISFIISIL